MNRGSKTLIILTPGFPANEADSTWVPFPQLFVRTLKRLNPSLEIIVLSFQYPFAAAEYNWFGVRVIPFNGRLRGKLYRLMLWWTIWRKLKQIAKQNDIIGILNFWLGECALIGKYAAKRYNVRSFTWLLGQDAKKNNRYFFLTKPGADSLIALSDFLSDEFSRNYGFRPAYTIPPGIDGEYFSAEMPARDIDILGAGSLSPLKRYHIFIEVVAKLAVINPSIRAVICGGGSERENLQRMIDDNNLGNNITLYGKIDHQEVLALMQRSKLLLHPSEYEGFSTVLSEALYAGAHVVAFCQPMNTGFKHQHVVKTETEMMDKVQELLNDTHLNHEKIITYPIELTCKKVLQLYGF